MCLFVKQGLEIRSCRALENKTDAVHLLIKRFDQHAASAANQDQQEHRHGWHEPTHDRLRRWIGAMDNKRDGDEHEHHDRNKACGECGLGNNIPLPIMGINVDAEYSYNRVRGWIKQRDECRDPPSPAIISGTFDHRLSGVKGVMHYGRGFFILLSCG